jgi:hypothetical protein
MVFIEFAHQMSTWATACNAAAMLNKSVAVSQHSFSICGGPRITVVGAND